MSMGIFEGSVIGNLGKDPEMSVLPDGTTKVAKFSLAVNRKRRDVETVSWVNINAFNKLAELATQYLRKGNEAYVSGNIEVRKWTGQDGIERTSVEMTANNIKFLGGKKESSEPPAPAVPAPAGYVNDDDIPF